MTVSEFWWSMGGLTAGSVAVVALTLLTFRWRQRR